MFKLGFSVSLILLVFIVLILMNQLLLITDTSHYNNEGNSHLLILNSTLKSLRDDLREMKINLNAEISTPILVPQQTEESLKPEISAAPQNLQHKIITKRRHAILFTMDSISDYEARSKHGGCLLCIPIMHLCPHFQTDYLEISYFIETSYFIL